MALCGRMAFVMALVMAALTLAQAKSATRAKAGVSLDRKALDVMPQVTGVSGKRLSVPSGFLQVSAKTKHNVSSMTDGPAQSGHRDHVPRWKEYELDGHTFYVNTVTGSKQWTKPYEVATLLTSFVATDPEAYVGHSLIASSNLCDTVLYHKMTRFVHESDITLAFQGDVRRLAQLQEIAGKWQGPISASILVLESDFAEVDRVLAISPVMRENVDLNFCVAKERWAYYPINKMRNHANRHARSNYLFIMDGDEDCVQSMQVFKDDLQQALLSTSADPSETAFIVTSWQWGDQAWPASEYPRTKADISRLSREGKAVCKANDFPQAYMPLGIGLDAWIGTDVATEVPWHDRYEPYMVVHRATIGAFDERFVGWGGNKAIHTMKMQLRHIRWILLPNAFTFTDESMVEDNATLHSLPADPDLPERAAMELGRTFGCEQCTYKECITKCLKGLNVHDLV